MSELQHIILDTETLGTRENAVVLSIGAVAFSLIPNQPNNYEDYILQGFYTKFSVKDQIKNYGRKIEEGTVEWWKQQSSEAQMVLKPSEDDYEMLAGLSRLNEWIKQLPGYKWNTSYVWSRGTYFDFPKLESMYEQAGLKCGYNSWKIRDVRTMIDVLTGDTWGKYNPRGGDPAGFVPHHALHDAAMDAYRMVEIFNDAAGGE